VYSAESFQIPDEPPDGFTTVTLASTNPLDSDHPRANAPTGSFWYSADGRSLEWFIRAKHLESHRAYRLELDVDNRANYSVASLQADSTGQIVGHGALTAFTNKVCVGDDAESPQPLTGRHDVRVSVKADGSPRGGTFRVSSPTSPSNALPCSGNGDGSFEYLLAQRGVIVLGEDTAPGP
jgi:hypothetical protein